jgi:hypothetical protein
MIATITREALAFCHFDPLKKTSRLAPFYETRCREHPRLMQVHHRATRAVTLVVDGRPAPDEATAIAWLNAPMRRR